MYVDMLTKSNNKSVKKHPFIYVKAILKDFNFVTKVLYLFKLKAHNTLYFASLTDEIRCFCNIN